MAKQVATENSFEVCDEALQLHGGYGYLKVLPTPPPAMVSVWCYPSPLIKEHCSPRPSLSLESGLPD